MNPPAPSHPAPYGRRAFDRARAAYLTGRTKMLYARFENTKDPRVLEDAIETTQRVLDARPGQHADRWSLLNSLGSLLHDRYQRTGAVGDLDRGIEAKIQAVAAGRDETERAIARSDLSAYYRTRYTLLQAWPDLERAVANGREALEATRPDDVYRAAPLLNLGITLTRRYERTGSGEDLDEAIVLEQEAVNATARNDPSLPIRLCTLSDALLLRFHRGRADFDLRRAITAARAVAQVAPAGSPGHGMSMHSLGRALEAEYRTAGDRNAARQAIEAFRAGAAATDAAPVVRASCARGWAQLSGETGDWTESRGGLRQLLDLLPVQVSLALGRDDRQLQLVPYQGIAQEAAAVEIQLGDLERAWAVLEEGRGVLIGHALDAREGFAQPPTLDQIRAAAGGGTVVTVNMASTRCDALLLGPDGADHVPLPALHLRDAAERANAFVGAAHLEGGPDAEAEVAATLAWLWEVVAGPVLRHLGCAGPPSGDVPWPRIWWIPTGPVAAFPLHAATAPDGVAVMDCVLSSYAPTLRVLHRARLARPGAGAGRPLIVGISAGAGQPPLGDAAGEAELVRQALGRSWIPPRADSPSWRIRCSSPVFRRRRPSMTPPGRSAAVTRNTRSSGPRTSTSDPDGARVSAACPRK